MGTLLSPVSEIDAIRWTRPTGRAKRAKAVIVIPQDGQHDIMVAALEDGSFTCSRDLSKYAYMPGQWPWLDGVVKALVKLGAITQDAGDRHMEACRVASERKSNRYRAENLVRLAEETSIPLSNEQAAFVAAHTRAVAA